MSTTAVTTSGWVATPSGAPASDGSSVDGVEVGVPRSFGDKVIEIVAVLLLGLATISTAWSAYESAQWNEVGSQASRAASEQQLEATRLFGLATQKVAYDSSIIGQYAFARQQGNERLLTFYRQTLIRPEFLPVLARWEAEVRAGRAPVPLSEDESYTTPLFAEYRTALDAASRSAQEAEQAGSNSTAYIATTILLAASLFFAGVISSFTFRVARALLLAAALVALGLAVSRLAALPVVW